MKTGFRRFQTGLYCATALALGILTVITAHAQPGTQLWLRRYIDLAPTNSVGRRIAVDADGSVIVAGNMYGQSFYNDWLVLKYSNAGEQLWVNSYDGPGHADDEVNAVAVDAHGNVFVTGFSDTFGILCNDCYPSLDYTTIAYSSAGVPLWTNRYGGPNQWESDDEPVAIVVDGNGDVVVTGISARYAYLYDWVTVKYSGAGVPLWTNRYNSANTDAEAAAVAVDNNGNVFVTGYSYGGGGSWAYATIKYSGAGVPLWTNRYHGPTTNGFDAASAMAVDRSGNVSVTGSSYDGSNVYSYATIAYANDGLPLWTNRYPGAGSGPGTPHAAAVDRSGNVFVTGHWFDASGQYDYATLAYSNDGTPLWTNRYYQPGTSGNVATALAVDSNGNVFVTGNTATIAYSSAGVPLWTNRYPSPAIAVDGSGNVFATGSSTRSGGGYDATTIKYASAVIPLRIAAAEKLGDDLRLRFASQAGFHYNVQARADLVGGDWSNVATNIPSSGAMTEVTLTNALLEAKQFYRVQQSP